PWTTNGPDLKPPLPLSRTSSGALGTAAWPAALHGISSSPLGERRFTRMRSDAMKSIGLRAPGANPLVQLSLVGFSINDPGFFALQATFKDAKFLAGQDALTPLLDLTARDLRVVPGPATLLLQRANSVGFQWDVEQQVFRDEYGTMGLSEVLQRLVFRWQNQVQHSLTRQPTFEGMEDMEPHLTNLVAGQVPALTRGLLRLSLNGTFFTNNALKRAGQADSPFCDFCGCLDSIRHRLLDCPFFQDCRRECRLDQAQLEGLPAAQLLHAWAPRPPSLDEFRRRLIDTEGNPVDFHPFPVLEGYHLFVDGSCLRPTTRPLSLASWAVIIASPVSYDMPIPLADGVVPGLLQSAFRAELCAMVSALLFCVRVAKRTWIWSDCQGVVRRVRSFLEGSWTPCVRTRHADLWLRILPHQEILARLIVVCKVTSHLQPDLETTFGDEWCSYYNNQVDRAAEQAQSARGSDFLNLWQGLCEDWDRFFSVAKEVAALHVRVGHKATRNKVSRDNETPQPAPQPDWVGSLGRLGQENEAALANKYGSDFIRDLRTWAGLLDDPAAPVKWVKLGSIPLRMRADHWHEIEVFLAQQLPQRAISGHR
ncbi:unnamed protein product, partial [Symbiodinium pilosum]